MSKEDWLTVLWLTPLAIAVCAWLLVKAVFLWENPKCLIVECRQIVDLEEKVKP